ncbi:MAG: HAMP domain-containing protein [Acidobacteria bacterium]|nr:HAMP domain-containing protein [Acidobacteriota bacterium]MYE44675.1 HAMP domain-containing protein [Acidobacteriota bacterium]
MALASFEGGGEEGATPTRRERRVTLIASDGTVLADSHEEAPAMDNHRDRPEVIAAFATGYGRSQRFSDTRGEDLTYVAVRLPWRNDTVLRLSEPVVRLEETVRAILTPVIVVTALAFIVAAVLSLWYAARFGERIARLVRFSERVARGDFTPETSPLRMDELDQLLASLNRTALELQRSFESLTAEKNQGATILSSVAEGVAVVDEDLRIQYVNGAFREVLSLPGESWRDYRGRHVRNVLEKKRLLKMVRAAMQGTSDEREISLNDREVLVRAAPIRPIAPERPLAAPASGNGAQTPGPSGAVLVLMDVTQLHALERVRRDFVANLSHEMKTPLTAIRGFSETLLDGNLEGPPEQRRFLGIIRQHAIRLSHLTDDLMRLARIEAGKLEAEPVPVDVQAVVESVLESARPKAGERSLAAPVPDGGRAVETDPTLLTEILENLVDNAIRYSAIDGRIAVGTTFGDAEVRVSVSDNGVGIPKAHLGRIFERFYRVDPARSREVGGTGLGLAIAKHTVEVLGGRIEVESAPKRGSTFTVVLPAPQPDAPVAEISASGDAVLDHASPA